MSHTKHEPQPVKTEKPAVPVTTRVIQDLRDKSEAGVAKYGVPLHTFNGRRPLVDAYQEALDLAQYLKQAIMEEDIEAGRDSLWMTDIDLALGDQHYGDMIRIRDLEAAMRRQSEDHASEMNRLQAQLTRQNLVTISDRNKLEATQQLLETARNDISKLINLNSSCIEFGYLDMPESDLLDMLMERYPSD